MKKVMNNILLWLVLVWVSFALVFTALYMWRCGGLIEAISYKMQSVEKPYIFTIESKDLEAIIKLYDEFARDTFNQYDENSNEKILELKKLYSNYPVGTVQFLNEIGGANSISELYILCLIIAVTAGTIGILTEITLKQKISKRTIIKQEDKEIKKDSN